MKKRYSQYHTKRRRKNFICIIIFAIVTVIMLATLPFSQFFESFINKEYYKQLENEDLTSEELVYNKDDLSISYVDVGSADAIVIELPDDKVMLIDSGNSGQSKLALLDYLSNNVYIDRDNSIIDYFVLTHPDSDHYNGIVDIMRDYEVKQIYRPKVLGSDEKAIFENDGQTTVEDDYNVKTGSTYNKAINAIYSEIESGATMEFSHTGIVIESDVAFDSPYKFTFLAPNDDNYGTNSSIESNTYSAVLLLEYKEKKFLFTGDATGVTEGEVLDYANKNGIDLDCDILKVAHHGSNSHGTSGADFLSVVKPEYAIISCKEGAYDNLPSSDTIRRIEEIGGVAPENILRTDLVGTVIVGFSTNSQLMVIVGDEVMTLNNTSKIYFVHWYSVVFVVIFITGSATLSQVRFAKKKRKDY
ncbi:MAG: ComEC/Rec2 family competence protein [Christensenellales bacterium]